MLISWLKRQLRRRNSKGVKPPAEWLHSDYEAIKISEAAWASFKAISESMKWTEEHERIFIENDPHYPPEAITAVGVCPYCKTKWSRVANAWHPCSRSSWRLNVHEMFELTLIGERRIFEKEKRK